jgi:hypothetical protein
MHYALSSGSDSQRIGIRIFIDRLRSSMDFPVDRGGGELDRTSEEVRPILRERSLSDP